MDKIIHRGLEISKRGACMFKNEMSVKQRFEFILDICPILKHSHIEHLQIKTCNFLYPVK